MLKILRGEHRYRFLGAFLLLELAMSPFLVDSHLRHGLLGLIHTGILIAAVYAISDSRRTLLVGTVLAAPALVRAWFPILPGGSPEALAVVGLSLTAALYVFVAVHILRDILRRERVSTDAVIGGVCTYLLLGYAFAVGYAVVWMGNPGAFSVDMAALDGGPSTTRFAYFSFVTLTTLGYGDISPVDPRAQMLAVLEAITGVLFLATLISRLVSEQKS